jgi:hypothetical protein
MQMPPCHKPKLNPKPCVDPRPQHIYQTHEFSSWIFNDIIVGGQQPPTHQTVKPLIIIYLVKYRFRMCSAAPRLCHCTSWHFPRPGESVVGCPIHAASQGNTGLYYERRHRPRTMQGPSPGPGSNP